uniref:Uncharacterized protein n=1 Tax=Caenorhabditis japonica TaxID=281687 RepID=A0A8R1DJJ2_CAEJA
MMGYSCRAVIALLMLSVLIAVCVAVPNGYGSEDVVNEYPMLYDDVDPFDLQIEGTEEPLQKRAVMRMGKRAMMRFGKRAMMRFGKRSVFRLG